MMRPLRILPALILSVLTVTVSVSAAVLPEASPAEVGLDADRLVRIGAAVEKAIAGKKVPGAVVVVGRRGKIAYARAFGRRAVEPAEEPLTRDTAFDLASLTKPVATATSVMILVEQGK